MTGETALSGPRLPEVGTQPMRSVFARTRFQALHNWPGAWGSGAYLKHPHRHEFHIEAEVPVSHADRDVEFIDLKTHIDERLRGWFGRAGDDGHDLPDLGETSCEALASQIAQAVISHYDVAWCQVIVSEDGENGSRVLELR